jgi:hypothetical protein
MKRKWTHETASRCLAKYIDSERRAIIAPVGFYGLKECSAADYLTNHCGYIRRK